MKLREGKKRERKKGGERQENIIEIPDSFQQELKEKRGKFKEK